MSSFYEILKVGNSASSEEIKKAFRSLATQYHPDKHQKDKEIFEKKFKEILLAYETLIDSSKRQAYDAKQVKKASSKPQKKPKTADDFRKEKQEAEKEKRRKEYERRLEEEYGRPPSAPFFDLWGNPLSQEERQQWVLENSGFFRLTSPKNLVKKRATPSSDGYFFDAFAKEYAKGEAPKIRR